MKHKMLAVALGSMLLGGVAVASYSGGQGSFYVPEAANDAVPTQPAPVIAPIVNSPKADFSNVVENVIEDPEPKAEWVDVIAVTPVRETQTRYADVINVSPNLIAQETPRQVCRDVVVEDRAPERDGNVGGTVAGAVVGGLLGNQVGKGNGKKAATAAGAVLGGWAGHEIDKRHVGGKKITRTEQQCTSETGTTERQDGYKVTYRTSDGRTVTEIMDKRPPNRIVLGSDKRTTAYDVKYRADDGVKTVRMQEKPGKRVLVVDGEVVQTAGG
jgi:uncharacterized protein YcfJ